MALLRLLQLWLLAAVLSCTSANVIDTVAQTLVSNVIDPAEKFLFTGLSSQCTNIKSFFGLKYDQLEEHDKEPDVDELTLDYISNEYNHSFPISTAAEDILATGHYRFNETLYIFLHGFIDDTKTETFGTVREALFSVHKANVLALNAHPLIKWLYLRSSTYVRFIGEKLAQVLVTLVKNNVDPKKIHIIGHSLGSHIASFAGKTFTNITGDKIKRITGLDPAGPCFSHVNDTHRLQPSDALFVDVIHTNAGVLGLNEPCGHVDYWPNGGTSQLGCGLLTCDHSRAWEYYAESIKDNKAFEAVACESWDHFKKGNCSDVTSYMGFATNDISTGYQFYLKTATSPPYGLGHDGITYD